MACFFVWGAARADQGLLDRASAVIDSIARGLDRVGKKTEDFIAPNPGLGEVNVVDFSRLVVVHREFDESYPVHASALVSISNKFGEVRIDVWESQVVRIVADISVGAESADIASQIARSIDLRVTHSPEHDEVGVETIYPDTRGMGKVATEVNYVVTVPKDAAVMCDNAFGDTVVRGTGGPLVLNTWFGVVDIRDIAGPANVTARGEFPLHAYGLRQGGTFVLRDTEGEFGAVSGTLKVDNFMGSVTVRDLAAAAELDITTESGPINLYLAEDATPDIVASTIYGDIESDIPLERTSRRASTFARSRNLESTLRIALQSTFGRIFVLREGAKPDLGATGTGGAYLVRGALEREAGLPEGMELVVDAIVGDLFIEGVDKAELTVTATQLVRVRSTENAQAVLETLALSLDEVGNRLVLRTFILEDPAALGCTSYRIDLVIQCPRTTPLKVRAQKGHTSITGTGAATVVEQTEGAITVEHSKGELELTNHKGNIQVLDCSGPADLSASYGSVTARNVFYEVLVNCVQGKTIVDAPRKGVIVRNRGGDVRIIALDGVGGNYDIAAEDANLRIALPSDADATLLLTIENGMEHSAHPLTGTIVGEVRKFTGLNSGQYKVMLSTKNGDIFID